MEEIMSDSTRSATVSRFGARHLIGITGSVAIHLALFVVLLAPIHAAPVAARKPAKPAPIPLAMECSFPATTPEQLRTDAATAASSLRLRIRNQALLDVRIGYDGTPVDVRVLSGTGDGYLDQLAICATMRRTYGSPSGLAWLGSDRLLVPVAFPSERR
jgi:hypothetical protein